MPEYFTQAGLEPYQLMAMALCALLVGMSKTGVAGVHYLVVPLMARVFEARMSTGVLLPMLIMGDVLAVWYYRREAAWHYIWRLIPWTLAGVVLGTLIGGAISPEAFRGTVAVLVLGGIAVMVWLELHPERHIPDSAVFAGAIGLLGGITTMIGNMAGPVMTVYFLSMRLPKNAFIGTGAWFFLLVNVSKIPFQFFGWGTLSPSLLVVDLAMMPVIIAGAAAGFWIVKHIPEQEYRRFVIGVTVLSALMLFI
ncbi:MAG: sulfite exporter TauE/SafE family protein [Bacteroidia bacterium]|nr:sulfite exporter TauE/SafE family protein [Bacteroidia bacterium]